MGTSVLEGDLQQRDELGCAGQPGIAPGCSLGAFPEAPSWCSSSICARTALRRCLISAPRLPRTPARSRT